jgi:photosystem II stability/assembly factor-like uncharacterized protein
MWKTFIRFSLSGILITCRIVAFTQCSVDAGADASIICGDSVQLNAECQWVGLNIGEQPILNSVYFTDVNTGYAVGNYGIILKTTNGGTDWISQNSGTSDWLQSVYFSDSNIGYAVGGSTILKTTNGGTDWASQNSGTSNWLHSVYFSDANIGYAVGYHDNGNFNPGLILKTTNGGTDWVSQNSGSSWPLKSVYFTDENKGYAVGDHGIILKTTNGGTDWVSQNSGLSNWLNSVYFSDANTGFAVGCYDNGYWFLSLILKTTNGGTEWIAGVFGSNQSLNSVCFTDANNGYAVGSNGLILKTTNGGADWKSQNSGIDDNLNSVCFSNATTVYIAGGHLSSGAIYMINPLDLLFSWSPAEGLNATNIAVPLANPIITTNYTVTMTTAGGCIATDSVKVNVYPLTANAGLDKTIFCGGTALLDSVETNYTGSGVLKYHWSPSTGLNNDSIPNPTSTITGDITYTVIVTTPNGCVATDSVTVFLAPPMNPPNICFVGVDGSNKNIVVWEKPASTAVDTFSIFRESNVTGVYQKIGSVSYSSLCVFTDTSSNPAIQSNKYKISIMDNCGLESPPSSPHKTMHLTINQGQNNAWNLIWEPYEGFTVSTYYIYRGTTPANMLLIGTTSGSSNQYSDFTAPTGFIYYQVEVMSSIPCNPSKSGYTSARSNIATNNPSYGIDNKSKDEVRFIITPNPANDYFILDFPEYSSVNKPSLELWGIDGQLIKRFPISNFITKIDIADLSSGVYFIRLIKSKGVGVRRIIKE